MAGVLTVMELGCWSDPLCGREHGNYEYLLDRQLGDFLVTEVICNMVSGLCLAHPEPVPRTYEAPYLLRQKHPGCYECTEQRLDAVRKRKGGYPKHGGHGTPEYRTWQSMKDRCLRPNGPAFDRYGAQGVLVFAPWISDFGRFHDDVGDRPSPGMSLDRIDPYGDYCPDNVRWADHATQAKNKRQGHVLPEECYPLKDYVRDPVTSMGWGLQALSQRAHAYVHQRSGLLVAEAPAGAIVDGSSLAWEGHVLTYTHWRGIGHHLKLTGPDGEAHDVHPAAN